MDGYAAPQIPASVITRPETGQSSPAAAGRQETISRMIQWLPMLVKSLAGFG